MKDQALKLRAFKEVTRGKRETGKSLRAAFIERYKQLRADEIEQLRARIRKARTN